MIESPEERRVRVRAKTREEEEDEFDFWFGDGGNGDGGGDARRRADRRRRGRRAPRPRRHEAMVRAAAGVDLRDVAESGAVRVHGRDFIGRRVVSVDAVSLELWLKSGRGRDRADRSGECCFTSRASSRRRRRATRRGAPWFCLHGGGG